MSRVFRRRPAEESPSPPPAPLPVEAFHNPDYLRHNQRRQEHLATLGLPLAGRSVLELGAGIGDHSSFFLDRGCRVTITEAREENVEMLRERFPDQEVLALDVENPDPRLNRSWDVVYAYGLLYHLSRPAEAIDFMARCSDALLLLETCVSPGEGVELNPISEWAENPSQATSGTGCRPTRPWVMETLGGHFERAYVTETQPWHPEFPLDWSSLSEDGLNTRAVFVASREPLDNPQLTEKIPLVQRHH